EQVVVRSPSIDVQLTVQHAPWNGIRIEWSRSLWSDWRSSWFSPVAMILWKLRIVINPKLQFFGRGSPGVFPVDTGEHFTTTCTWCCFEALRLREYKSSLNEQVRF